MKVLKYIAVAVLGVMMLTAQGCLRDEADKAVQPEFAEPEVEMLTINVRIPEMKTATRATDENAIDKMAVLVFDWDESGESVVETIESIPTVKTLSNSGGVVQLSIPKPELPAYELVVLANYKDKLIEALQDELATGYTKDVFAQFGFGNGDTPVFWNADGSQTAIPMAGESGKITATSGDITIEVPMIRMYAKMSLTMADTASDFTDILFCNFYNNAVIYSDGYSSFTPALFVDEDAPGSNIVAEYAYSAGSVTLPTTATGDLYVCEAPATSDADYLNGAYLLVQAKYNGTYYWYRINLISDGTVGGTTKGDYLPIIRNYDYKITINSVNGPGLETPEEAAATKNTVTNLDYSVFALNDDMFTSAGYTGIIYDGNYFMAFNNALGVGVGDGVGQYYSGTLEVFTNFNYLETGVVGADEWTVTAAAGDAWYNITVSDGTAVTVNGTAGKKYTLTITPTEGLPAGVNAREGVITVTAGKLTMQFYVNQQKRSSLTLKTLPVEGGVIRMVSWNGEKIITDYTEVNPKGTLGLMDSDEFQIAAVWNTPDGQIDVSNILTNGGLGNTVDPSNPYPFFFTTTAPYDSWVYNGTNTYDSGSYIFNIKPLQDGTSGGDHIAQRTMLTFKNTDGVTLGTVDVMYRQLYAMLQGTGPVSGTKIIPDLYMCIGAGIENLLRLETNTRASVYAETWPTQFATPQRLDYYDILSNEMYADPFSYRAFSGDFAKHIFEDTATKTDLMADSLVVKYTVESTPFPAAETQEQSYDVALYPMLEAANSYIAKPNSRLAAIPLPQLSNALGYDYVDDDLSAVRQRLRVEWSDRVGVIRKFGIQGWGHNVGIVVDTGVEGNAVISMYDTGESTSSDDDTILWSWHIWVTDDKDEIEAGMTGHPNWMDRNLGALDIDWGSATSPTTDEKNDVYSRLYYQWGRKDPFAAQYYLNGGTTPTNLTTAGAYSGAMSITNSVQNPLLYYADGTANFTGNGVNTWGDGTGATKSIYDPCPPGWRVPTQNEMPVAGDYTIDATAGKIDFGGGFWLPTAGALNVGVSGSTIVEGVYPYLTDIGYTGNGNTALFIYNSQSSLDDWQYANYGGSPVFNVRCIKEGTHTPSITIETPEAFATGGGSQPLDVTLTNITGLPKVTQAGDTSDATASWLTATLSSDGTTLTLVAAPNTGVARTATVTLTGNGGATASVTVTQDEPPLLYVGMFGGELKETDGVWQFTKPLYVQAYNETSTNIQWQTSNVASGVTTSNADGRLSTWNLNTESSTNFPAANLCYKKNTGIMSDANDMVWYLPAQKQLMAVWVAQESFGSNKLSTDYYWSATEYDATRSWYIYFFSGFTSYVAKDTNSQVANPQVRCVRE
jgi:hypothetical protein